MAAFAGHLQDSECSSRPAGRHCYHFCAGGRAGSGYRRRPHLTCRHPRRATHTALRKSSASCTQPRVRRPDASSLCCCWYMSALAQALCCAPHLQLCGCCCLCGHYLTISAGVHTALTCVLAAGWDRAWIDVVVRSQTRTERKSTVEECGRVVRLRCGLKAGRNGLQAFSGLTTTCLAAVEAAGGPGDPHAERVQHGRACAHLHQQKSRRNRGCHLLHAGQGRHWYVIQF